MTHNSANQRRIATGEVSKCAEENRHEPILFSHKISVSILCTATLCAQFTKLALMLFFQAKTYMGKAQIWR